MVTKRIQFCATAAGVMVLLASVLGAGFGPRAAGAQGQHLEGAWIVTVTSPGQPPATALHTYTPDGIVLVSSGVKGATVDRSLGHGAWVRTGNREFGRTWVQLRFDDKGAPAGATKVRSIIRLNETMDEWIGVAIRIDVLDPNGNPVSSTSPAGLVDRGRRIRVEAP